MRSNRLFCFGFAAALLLLAACAPAPTPQPTATLPPLPSPTPLPPTPTPNPHPDLLDDFENIELARGLAGSADIGFVTWSDGSPVSISLLPLTGAEARPGQSEPNTVLALETELGSSGWGGFTHAFADPGLVEWVAQDWRAYTGISLWIWGNNSGSTLFVDILENRKPGSSGDDAERWSYFFKDDFAGWKQVSLPFAEFTRKEIGNGAPNDGLTLEAVHGYAVGTLRTEALGVVINYVDEVRLYPAEP